MVELETPSLSQLTDEILAAEQTLALGGGDLAKLGLRGPDIGKAQKQIMAAIHNGEIRNDAAEIEQLLGVNK